MAAAREVGVSRAAGKTGRPGYKTYRHGLVTGFVPARAGRLAGTATHLQHLRPPVHAADGDQAREQLVRIGWPHAIIELGHFVERPATVTRSGSVIAPSSR